MARRVGVWAVAGAVVAFPATVVIFVGLWYVARLALRPEAALLVVTPLALAAGAALCVAAARALTRELDAS